MRFSATEEMKLNSGLLLLRIGLGVILISRGIPRLFGGVEQWVVIGEGVSYIGIESYFEIFGFLFASIEFFGGFFLFFGLFTFPAVLMLMIIMFFLMIIQISREADYPGIVYPLTMGIVFTSLLLTGPGRYSLDHKFRRLRKKRRRRRK